MVSSGSIRSVLSIATYSVVGLNEGIVDGNDLDIGVLDGIAENNAANATEAVDSDLDGSHIVWSW